MKNTKKILALLLAGTMALGVLTGCGAKQETTAPATETPAAEEGGVERNPEILKLEGMEYDERSDYLYDKNLGEFYELYLKAKDEVDNISLRYAMMAVAEAKLLESGVQSPQTTQGGAYAMTRVVPGSGTSVLWGDDEYRFHNLLVATELIKKTDRDEIKKQWNELKGTGTFVEWAKKYMADQGYTLKDSYNTNLFGEDPTTWDILSTSRTVDSYAPVQTYDGLLEYDCENVQQPALAESYEVSDDGLKYTFHLRKGVSWVDSQGREVAKVKADDFVAGFQHMIDTQSGLGDLLAGIVVNTAEYIAGDVTDFTQVGVKAVDDYTLEYTLVKPTPYFITMVGYNPFAPLSREYYTSQGGKFGAEFDSSAADYKYGKTPDNIAYCGPFLITNFTSKNVIQFKANESYWNKANVTIKSMTWPYEEQKDATKLYNDVKNGVVDGTGLNSSEVEAAKKDGLFDDYCYTSSTTGTTFSVFYNLYRTCYANFNDETKMVSVLTDEEKDLANLALGNANFRLALTFAKDTAALQALRVGEELKNKRLRNSYTPAKFVSLAEDVTIDINGTSTTFPAGTWYGEIIQAQLDADGIPIKVYDKDADDGAGGGDGYDGWYNPDNAAKFMDKAVEELAAIGVTIDAENPVRLEIPYSTIIEWNVNQANAYKQSVEAALGGRVIIELVGAEDNETWYYTGYYTETGSQANYNITDQSGWGPDYGDPATFLDTFLPDYNGYVTRSIGIY